MKEYIVYIVRCADGSYSTGITNDVGRRVSEHNDGRNPTCYTYKRRPVELVYRADFREVTEAIAWETEVKGWSRKKKEALITDDTPTLQKLSRARNASQYLAPKSIRYLRYRIRHRTSVMMSPSVMASSDEP